MNRRHIAGNFLLSHTHHQSVPRTSTSCHAPLAASLPLLSVDINLAWGEMKMMFMLILMLMMVMLMMM